MFGKLPQSFISKRRRIMKRRWLVSLIVLLSAPFCLHSADLAAGKQAYERGDFATAFRELRPLAEQGNPEAQLLMGFMYESGDGVEPDSREAVKWYRKAAQQGNGVAQYSLAKMIEAGSGVDQSASEAIRWYLRAAEGGNAFAQLELANKYRFGLDVRQSDAEAAKWCMKAALQGNQDAQSLLGRMYEVGEGVPQDFRQAANWYRKAAEQGEADALVSLGDLYAGGLGVRQDLSAAVQWYSKAAAHGSALGQLRLGEAYYFGDGLGKDYVEAARWFREAADKGDPWAASYLGDMYLKGEGLPKSPGEAFNWYRKAAEKGNSAAQGSLGLLYQNGEGVPRNYSEALKWYTKAAARGVVAAQNNLGVMYEFGEGVLQDYLEAAKWYRKAAERGLAKAQRNLGSMYFYGNGVPQDYVQAHMWFNLASARGEEDAASLRDRVAALMTPEQIATAQSLARNWPAKVDFIPERSQPRATRAKVEKLPSRLVSSGTGFFANRLGHLVTNNHVVEGCTEVKTELEGVRHILTLVARDRENDMALLKLQAPLSHFATFSDGRSIRPGQSITVVGFPLRGVLGSSAIITTGNVSALAGPRDDTRLIQITAPVQLGNSGGPLLDQSGNVAGMIIGKLDALRVARATGDIPQNVNFAIKASVLRTFLDANNVEYVTAPSTTKLDNATVGEKARRFTLVIECWK